MSVFVTNCNDFPHFDRYSGQDFCFAPNEEVALDDEAAAHMFGYGRADKTDNLLRLGWANMKDDEGVKRLANFVFSRAVLVKVSAEPERKVDLLTAAAE